MQSDLDELRTFVTTIADGNRDLDSLGGPILHYGLFLRRIVNEVRPDFIKQRDLNAPTQLLTGEALTPWHAAACMEDRTRTAAFVRGAIRAVEFALNYNSKRPLHLVEAGCGPLGTLVLPLLSRFSEEELVVSLADLHEESIATIAGLLEHFGLSSRVQQLLVGDVTSEPFGSNVDLVLTETMNTALSKEPQVAITRALMQQHPEAVLIPQSIRIDLTFVDLQQEMSHFPPRVLERQTIMTIFDLNRTTALQLTNDQVLSITPVEMPFQIDPKWTPCLTTTIQVFDDIQTNNYETQISHPVPLLAPGDVQSLAGKKIQFEYRMQNSPGFLWQIIE